MWQYISLVFTLCVKNKCTLSPASFCLEYLSSHIFVAFWSYPKPQIVLWSVTSGRWAKRPATGLSGFSIFFSTLVISQCKLNSQDRHLLRGADVTGWEQRTHHNCSYASIFSHFYERLSSAILSGHLNAFLLKRWDASAVTNIKLKI